MQASMACHACLGRRAADWEQTVKGGEATCEALDWMRSICYPVTFCIKSRAPAGALMHQFWSPFASPNASVFVRECIKSGARNFRVKPAACEWTGSAGSSHRRRSQCGNGGSAGLPAPLSGGCPQRRCSTGRTQGWM